MVRLEFLPPPEWLIFDSDDDEEYHLEPDTGIYVSELTDWSLAQDIVDQLKEQFKKYTMGRFVYEDNNGYITKKLNRMTTHCGLYDLAKQLIEETIQSDLGPIEFASRLIQLPRKHIRVHGRDFCVVPRLNGNHIELIVSADEMYGRVLFTVCCLYD